MRLSYVLGKILVQNVRKMQQKCEISSCLVNPVIFVKFVLGAFQGLILGKSVLEYSVAKPICQPPGTPKPKHQNIEVYSKAYISKHQYLSNSF